MANALVGYIRLLIKKIKNRRNTMAEIKLFRIDSRLIHGQIITKVAEGITGGQNCGGGRNAGGG